MRLSVFQIFKINPEFMPPEPETPNVSIKHYILGAIGVASLFVGVCLIIVYVM